MSYMRWIGPLACVVGLAGCGSPDAPSGTTSTTTSAGSTSTTTTTPPSGTTTAHYAGTVTPPGGAPAPIDLSLFFNIPGGASFGRLSLHPLATFNVTGGFNTNGPSGSGGFTASVEGTLDGAPLEGGTFTGVLSTRLSNGCVAKRNYAGPLSTGNVNWTPGAHVDACGGASPLTFSIVLTSIPTPATTSTPTTTTSTPSQSNLAFTFSPNPAPGMRNLTCSGASAPSPVPIWRYSLTIRNSGNVPFTASSWTTSLSAGITQNTLTFAEAFGVSTIPSGGSATANLCASPSGNTTSGSLSHTFTGTGGNGPFTTPTLTLQPPRD